MSEKIKIEKIITEDKIKEIAINGSMEDIIKAADDYTLQYLKSLITQDAEFEIIEPKQLPEP